MVNKDHTTKCYVARCINYVKMVASNFIVVFTIFGMHHKQQSDKGREFTALVMSE